MIIELDIHAIFMGYYWDINGIYAGMMIHGGLTINNGDNGAVILGKLKQPHVVTSLD